MSELKPCPFCGGEAHIERLMEHSMFSWLVGCEHCNGDESTSVYVHRDTKDAAVTAWNTRPCDRAMVLEEAARVAEQQYQGHGSTLGTPRAHAYEHAGKSIAAAIRQLSSSPTEGVGA